jgi:hypothetical protein
VRYDHLETESERAAWQKGYDMGLGHEGEIPPLMNLSAMRNILARTAPPRDEEPAQDERVATRTSKQQSDGPLLDLTHAAVRRMIKLAKKRGYVTYDELNEVLSPEEFTTERIEDVLGQLSEMGIDVVESEEIDEALLARASVQNDITEEPAGGTFIPLVLQIMNDQSLSGGEKRAFALGLLRGLASRGE